MNPIITELDEETGEWDIVTDQDNEQEVMEQLIDEITTGLRRTLRRAA